ncbi:MAG: hypothetical protein J5985_06745 [Kiritimatiellae bacterium]|nr:hypothetical protein [Kiritimatiellia bacterium]
MMAIMQETKHSMLRRCRGWDYCQPCIYMITLVLADRRSKALGRLVVDGLALPRQAQDRTRQAQGRASIVLSPAGEAVFAEFRRIGEHHSEIKPLFMQVMPDHVHFILQVMRPMTRPIGQAIAGFKAGSSKAAIGRSGFWAEGFQDTILLHEGQLDSMFDYLRDNPRRLAVKQLMPDFFRVRNDLCLALPRPVQGRAACSVPRAAALGLTEAGFTAHFSAIGNLFLLDSPSIIQVQCSRADFVYKRIAKPGGGSKIVRNADGTPIIEKTTPQFEEKRDELLAAAKHGAVLISPCISDGEREIARFAFVSSRPVIALRNMGFSPLYKPGGKLFDKTANGKLLLLAPAAWPYSTVEKPMTRFDACVMNRLAQLIAGPGAAEIDYKGMQPNDIERLVREAVAKTSNGENHASKDE